MGVSLGDVLMNYIGHVVNSGQYIHVMRGYRKRKRNIMKIFSIHISVRFGQVQVSSRAT